MKAIIYEKYGNYQQLNLRDIDQPKPKNHEVLVKVKAVSINTGDKIFLEGKPRVIRVFMAGLFKPKKKVLGGDISGIIEAVGKDVTAFKVGDEIFADNSMFGFGGLSEYTCLSEDVVALKPKNASFVEAAAIPLSASTALNGLVKHAGIEPHMDVLIHGASGNVGNYMVQLAKVYGKHVTAICSTRNVEQAKVAGADRVIDYKKDDFTLENKKYDLIVGANGYQPIKIYKKFLKDKGRYLQSGGSNKQMFEGNFVGPILSLFSDKKMMSYVSKTSLDNLNTLRELYENEQLHVNIERVYQLSEIPQAFKHFMDGQSVGKLVIEIN